jgi:hypothetical protein
LKSTVLPQVEAKGNTRFSFSWPPQVSFNLTSFKNIFEKDLKGKEIAISAES